MAERGSVTPIDMSQDAKIRHAVSDITILNNVQAAYPVQLTQYFGDCYDPTRPIVILRARVLVVNNISSVVPAVAGISNHTLGTLSIGIPGAPVSIFVPSAGQFNTGGTYPLQNQPAGTVVELVLAPALRSTLAEFEGGSLVPAGVMPFVTWTVMSASGTGAVKTILDWFHPHVSTN